MRIAIITESFKPLNTSAAVQLTHLADALRAAGADPVVVTPAVDQAEPVRFDVADGIDVIRLRMPFAKGEGLPRRFAFEALMPLTMAYRWSRIAAQTPRLDGVVWYSPSIFHGIFAGFLKRRYKCRGYLILRDIFPDWAVDLGVMSRRNPVYWILKLVERYQYRTANVIGVQTPHNLRRFESWRTPARRIEVLHNWHMLEPDMGCRIQLAQTSLAGRRIFGYAGNIGVAQNIDLFIDLAEQMRGRSDAGFAFVGRGSHFERLRREIEHRRLDNALCFDEIASKEIAGFYRQCDFGIVSLNPHHTTHNIPGKFISYVTHELPVLAAVNPGNDLLDMIEEFGIGFAIDNTDLVALRRAAEALLDDPDGNRARRAGCRMLSEKFFQPETAAGQVIAGLAGHEERSCGDETSVSRSV